MSSNLMNTEPGGQSDQYEDSLRDINEPHAKQTGSLGKISQPEDTNTGISQEKREQGERTAANIRYGQKLSEEGMGGQTDGLANNTAGQEGYGQVPAQDEDQNTAAARKQQGYGSGSGVGA